MSKFDTRWETIPSTWDARKEEQSQELELIPKGAVRSVEVAGEHEADTGEVFIGSKNTCRLNLHLCS